MNNNFFNNLYFFSKLTTSFILLILLVFFGFLFYKAYHFNNNNYENALDIKLNILSDKIQNLYSELNQINMKIADNQKSLNIFNENIKDNKLNKDFPKKIFELNLKNSNLNQEIDNLRKIVSSFENKINNKISNEPNFILKNSIDLIRMKYENGLDVKEEIYFIANIVTDNSKKSYFEKLIILSDKNFKGINALQSSYQSLMESYLNDYFVKKNNNLFYRYLSKFYSININKNSEFKDKTIETFSIIKNKLQVKDISSSLLYIKNIQNGSIYFKDWIIECEKYEEFNKNLKLVYNKI